MLERYTISDVKQLKALGHSCRVKILNALAEKAMTAKQLADLFSDEPAKTSYHVKQLLKVGLVELVYTRETQNGIVEKYYRAIAREFQTDPCLALRSEGRGNPEAEVLKALSRTQAEFLAACRDGQERDAAGSSLACGYDTVTLDQDTLPAFRAELQALLARYAAPASAEGNYVFHHLLYPAPQAAERARVKETV